MKKKKGLCVVFAILILIVLFATGYTFSKYYQSVTGNISLQVAPWIFRVTTNNNKPLSEITLQGKDGNLLAPGSDGSFDITIDATGSGVDIEYITQVTNENLPESFKFYVAGENPTTYETLTELANVELKGTMLMNEAQSQYRSYTICWEWPFDENSNDDSSAENYGFNIEVIGEQIRK